MSESIAVSKLQYAEYGDPAQIVQKVTEKLSTALKPDEVLVKMLASPVNPADLITITGKYAVRPNLPSVPGNEGVGEVISVGNKVKDFVVGDRVVPFIRGTGTWRTHMVLEEKNLLKIPSKLGHLEAATLMVNPCTAFRMLRDFVLLKPGDTVIQNGANSACGQYVIQICRARGIHSVNIIRNRPDVQEIKDYLTSLGASYVLTEEELHSTDIFKGTIPEPRLGLNCIGGDNSLALVQHLGYQATLVTYGGMSGKHVIIPTGALIYKDCRFRGFWMTEWFKRNGGTPECKSMCQEIISMMLEGKLKGPVYTMVPFENYKEIFATGKGMVGRKFILDFQ